MTEGNNVSELNDEEWEKQADKDIALIEQKKNIKLLAEQAIPKVKVRIFSSASILIGLVLGSVAFVLTAASAALTLGRRSAVLRPSSKR